MRGRIVAFALGVGLALTSSTAEAEEINVGALDARRPNLVRVETGIEHGFVASIGYGRVFRAKDRPLVLTGELTLPWARLDFGDLRARVGVQVPIVGTQKHWKLIGKVAPTLRSMKTRMHAMTSLGADLGVAGGYYRTRWFLAGELGVDWSMTTHIEHSALSRRVLYADAKDGWYGNPGGNFYYGLVGGVSFRAIDLTLRVGQARDLVQARPGLIPMVALLGLNVRFGDARRRGGG